MANYYNKMEGDTTLLKQNTSYLDGEVTVSVSSSLDGEIYTLGGGNMMYGSVDLIPPPKSYLTISPIYDTFVRDGYPTVSYGNNKGMYIGKLTSGEITRSFIKFTLDTMPQNMVITKASILLNNINLDSDIDLEIYTANKQWQENNTTWVNQPDTLDLINTAHISYGQPTVQFDVLNYIKSCYKNTIEDTGLVIKSSDETVSTYKGFYTKESNNTPQLLIEYYDPSVRNVGVTSFDGEINVYHNGEDYLDGEVTVKTTITTATEYFDGEIYVSKPEMYGEISIVSAGSKDGEITVYYNGLQEIDGEVIVSKPEMYSEMFVGVSSSLDGEIDITRINENYTDGEINIYRIEDNYLDGEIYLGKHEWLDGEITVYHNGENYLDGEIIVSKDVQYGEIYIGGYDWLDGEINVYHIDTQNVDGEVTVLISSSSSKDGETNVVLTETGVQDVDGEITVIYTVEEYVDGEIDIVLSLTEEEDLDGEIYVRSPNEQEGEIYIPYSCDFSGEITAAIPYTDDLEGEIYVTNYNEVDGEITIQYIEEKYLDAEITIVSPNELNGEVLIPYSSYMDGEVISSIPYILDMEAEVYIGSTATLDGEVIIPIVSYLNGEITAAVPYINDLLGEVTVGENDFDGYVFIM